MEPLLKSLVLVALIVLPSTLCNAQQRHSGDKPITRDYLSKLEPGKDYLMELKSGSTLEVNIQRITPQGISGISYHGGDRQKMTKLDYAESFETIEKNVVRITLLKREPFITARPYFVYKPEELDKIKKYQKMKITGTALTIVGGLLVVGGALSALTKSIDADLAGTEVDVQSEQAIIGVGALAFVPGVILLNVGVHKARRYQKELQAVSVGLAPNTSCPGLSLNLRF